MSSEQQVQGWFYVDGKQEKQGPLPPPEFKALADQGVIRGNTPVWTSGYTYWVPAEEVDGLVERSAPTPAASLPAAPTPASPPPPLPVSALAVPNLPVRTPAPQSTPSEPMPTEELKPRKGSFVFPRVMIGLVVALILTLVVCMMLSTAGMSPVGGSLVFVSSMALVLYAALAAYRKERYELQENTVICHRGGLVSDETTELEIRNITHVKVKLPWLRYKFFGVGNVLIESAGNAQPVVLRAIREPEEVYARMSERMKRNGYDLTQGELLHEERPAMLGVISELFSMMVGTFVVVMLGLPTIQSFSADMASAGVPWLSSVLGPFLVVVAVTYLVVHFLDLRRRTYRVYNDVVIYEEGFLTRENAFIPYENIADAATKRTFLDQLLNIYDVLISCQGSSSEIKFRRLRHGVQLSTCVDRLVLAAGRKPKPAPAKASELNEEQVSAHQYSRRDDFEPVTPSDAWIADLKMSPARVLAPLSLLFPLVPLWIAAMIRAGIKLFSTRYAVRPGSIRHSYRFLSTHDREFAYDKITGLVIKENLWDRIFGTVTLRFWSIGSGQSLEIAHVLRDQIDFEAIMRQIGIPASSAQPHEVTATCGPLIWLRACCLRIVFALLATVGLVVAAVQTDQNFFYGLVGLLGVLCVAGFVYDMIYYRRQRLRFHDHHVEAEQGIIARRRYYARYRNVKKTTVTRYPGGEEGSLQIFVAGEQEVAQQSEKKGKPKVAVPCSFTLGFLPGADEKGLLLDDILSGRVDPIPDSIPAEPLEDLFESPRGVGNSVARLVIFSVLLFPFIVLLPLTVPLTIYAKRKWSYRINAARVGASWGILFKKQTSVILDRVDSLQQQQGPLNKMFKNGNISIMTAGSSKPDLVLPAAPEYQTLYQEIRQRSQGA